MSRLDLLRGGDAKEMEAIFVEAAQGPCIFKDFTDADRYVFQIHMSMTRL